MVVEEQEEMEEKEKGKETDKEEYIGVFGEPDDLN